MRTGCAVIAVSDGQLTIAALVPCFPPRLLAFLFGDGVIERLEPIPPPCFRAKYHRRKRVCIYVLLIERLLSLVRRQFAFLPRNPSEIGVPSGPKGG